MNKKDEVIRKIENLNDKINNLFNWIEACPDAFDDPADVITLEEKVNFIKNMSNNLNDFVKQ